MDVLLLCHWSRHHNFCRYYRNLKFFLKLLKINVIFLSAGLERIWSSAVYSVRALTRCRWCLCSVCYLSSPKQSKQTSRPRPTGDNSCKQLPSKSNVSKYLLPHEDVTIYICEIFVRSVKIMLNTKGVKNKPRFFLLYHILSFHNVLFVHVWTLSDVAVLRRAFYSCWWQWMLSYPWI